MLKKRSYCNFPWSAAVVSVWLFGAFICNEKLKNVIEVPISWSKLRYLVFERGFSDVNNMRKCDLFNGTWVFDNVTLPLYREEQCKFLTSDVTCMRNGRKDSTFQNWKWQPRDCSLPKFSAELLLKRLTNKRMMFIGDSLNRQQWKSMLCLLQSAVPNGRINLTVTEPLRIFRLDDYNATVEFHWAPFLVESNSDDPKMNSFPVPIIMPEYIKKNAANWINVDYLIFNTYIWWMNSTTTKVVEKRGTPSVDIERPVAYRRMLTTWAKWIEENVNPKKTTVFFMGMSPLHIKPKAWKNPNGIKCALETMPIVNMTMPPGSATDQRIIAVARDVTADMRVPVHFMDITALSELRKDAHISVHTIRQGKILSPDQQAKPQIYADCIHWCLPGLPDTWNQFIYARLVSQN